MPTPAIPPAVQQLIWNQLRSVDHVAVLLAVRTLGAADAATVTAHVMLTPSLVAEILQELHSRALITRHGSEYRFEPDPSLGDAVAQLAEMYNTKPVTLVRAIYDWPAHIIQQFADAFLLRRNEERE